MRTLPALGQKWGRHSMVDEDDDGRIRYETKTVKAMRGTEGRSRAKWEADGWELVSQDTGKLRSELRFRRPKPPLPKVAILAGIGGRGAHRHRGHHQRDRRREPRHRQDGRRQPGSVQLTERERLEFCFAGRVGFCVAVRPGVCVATEGEAGDRSVERGQVEAVFDEYVAQRADANVLVAKAVTDVVLLGPVLRVTFDPSEVGMTQSEFDAANPFNNPYDKSESLADFVAAAVTSSSNRDLRVRRSVAVIAAVDANGKLLGKRTMAEIVRLNELPK